MLRKRTEKEQTEIRRIIIELHKVIENENPHLAMEAMTALLLGAINTVYHMENREAIDFCVKRLKTWAQTTYS